MQRNQWLVAIGYSLSCMVMLRLQIDLFHALGYPSGILGLLSESLFVRGIAVYGIFNMFYLILGALSKFTSALILMAASISIFLTAMIVSMVVMVL